MEYIIGMIVAILGVLLFKKKPNSSEIEAKIAKAKAEDHVLTETQKEVEAAIATLDAGIIKLKEQREIEARKQVEDSLTLKERADRIKKGLQ